jgi:hypothetical protein
MSESRAVDTVSGLDYEEIEQAVMETARGRWFLTEFARRQRVSDTKILLDAIRRLEDQLLAMPAASSPPSPEAASDEARPAGQTETAGPIAATPEKQLAAPAAKAIAEARPAEIAAPKFVPSDDDLFEPAPAPAAASAPAPAPVRPARSLGADTLDFSSIEVPPLPDRVSEDDDGESDTKDVATRIAGEPTAKGRDDDLKARDRVIQVNRTGTANNRRLSDFGPPPDHSTSGRINVSAPAAANQTAAAATPAAGVSASRSGTDAGNQKKRIIVIRRPAEGTDGIPLAGE